MEKRLHLIIQGKVQGVSFRVSAKKKAQELGITGTVQNLIESGHVEIYAEAEQEKLKEFKAWCEKGPEGADVKTCAAVWYISKRAFRDFKIIE
jgi:acylphosphatase